jgi:hypothetical protein
MRTLLAVLLLATAPACASQADGLSTARRPVIAERLTAPVAVDGALSEAVWRNGHAVADFRQRDPVEGAEPSQRTEVRVAYDDDAIYVGARCYDAGVAAGAAVAA